MVELVKHESAKKTLQLPLQTHLCIQGPFIWQNLLPFENRVLTFSCHMAREETTGDTWPANSCSAQWGWNRMRGKREGSRGAGASSRGRARQVSKWMACIAAPHVRACHNIPPHVHLSLCVATLSTLHMHSCPDCEPPNMSQFGANLSRLRHNSAAGAPGEDTVSPCSHSTSYVSLY